MATEQPAEELSQDLAGSNETEVSENVQPTASKPKRKRGRLRSLIFLVLFLAVLGFGGRFGYDYYLDSKMYVSTDDAMVDTQLMPVASLSSGTLQVWKVQPGDLVQAGQVLGYVKPASGSVYTTITAPIGGTILRVDGKEGQVIAQSQALAYIANLESMYITAYIDENDIHKIHIGQPVEITIDATGSQAYQGSVREIIQATAGSFALIPSTDRGTSNFTKVTQRIEIRIDIGSTSGLQIYPGENASVRIRVV